MHLRVGSMYLWVGFQWEIVNKSDNLRRDILVIPDKIETITIVYPCKSNCKNTLHATLILV